MSLVSEALKKAEREASARDAQARGAPAPFDAPLQPYRARGGGAPQADSSLPPSPSAPAPPRSRLRCCFSGRQEKKKLQ